MVLSFPALVVLIAQGYFSKVSRHYNLKFLLKLGIWKQQTKVLYSTRHTFINKCYQKGVDRDIIKSILRHEPDFTMVVYGGDQIELDSQYPNSSLVTIEAKSGA